MFVIMWGRNYYHKKNWSEILIFNRLKWENYFKADLHIFWGICRSREDAMRVSTCTVTQFSQTLNCVLPFGCPKSNFDSLLRGIASLYQLHSRQFWFEPSLSHITSIYLEAYKTKLVSKLVSFVLGRTTKTFE